MSEKITNEELKKRLQNIKNVYTALSDIINESFNRLPDFKGKDDFAKMILEKALNDKKLKKLFDEIDNNRPPRFMLVGHTGAGKSSLINALCDSYVAKVSDNMSETQVTESYKCKREGETILELLDTRGTAESIVGSGTSAENELIASMKVFNPDLILFVNPGEVRDESINRDAREIKNLCKKYKKETGVDIPLIAVMNKVDIISPTASSPSDYTEEKIEIIYENVERFKDIFDSEGLEYKEIIPVSSNIIWTVTNEKMAELDEETRLNASPRKDCRWNIDKLWKTIEANLPDEAAMGLALAQKITTAIKTLAKRFVLIFSEISAGVALMPIPFADMPILFGLQTVMVVLIAALSGEKLSVKAAQKFLIDASGIGIIGFLAKATAQQLAKTLNAVVPGSGSATSSAIAFGGTKIMGEAAIMRYINAESMSNVKKETKRKGTELKEQET